MMDENNEMAVANSNQETFEANKLYSANGSEIPTFGHKILTLYLGLRRELQFLFIIAKVDKGIIGADFLSMFNLLIDIRNKQLIDGITNFHVKDLMKPNLLVTNTKHDVKHYIAAKGPPVYSKARQLDSKKLEIAKRKNKLPCIDRFTCRIEVIPLSNITAETFAREFYNHWISRFGIPYRVITDQGTQFRSELFKNIGVICGFKVCTTTSYHPQCNGRIERIHRTLKAAIGVHNSVKWTQTLPSVLLGLRSALRSDTNYNIAQMIYEQTIRLPGEFFEKPKNVLDIDTFAEELQKQMDQLQPLKTRRQPSQKHFVHKDLPNRKGINISVDRLKPVYLLSTDGDNPDHFKQLEHEPTLSDKKLFVQRKIEKQPPDLLKKDVQKTTTRSGKHVTFPARYRD
ncbi:retrovirus-related Pol polyprotein from transposon 412 [Trichonephila clavipes]|nr:retrovirus-related Pol polyprotein from transposon 412 [Trichonephila clavipes]